MIDLTVTPDRIHHRPTESKKETMTNELPDWATDPRGRPPVYIDYIGDVWTRGKDGVYLWKEGLLERDTATLEQDFGPGKPLWLVSSSSGLTQLPNSPRRFTEHPIPAPDPDAEWIDAIIEADSPEVARTLIATIRGEQA